MESQETERSQETSLQKTYTCTDLLANYIVAAIVGRIQICRNERNDTSGHSSITRRDSLVRRRDWLYSFIPQRSHDNKRDAEISRVSLSPCVFFSKQRSFATRWFFFCSSQIDVEIHVLSFLVVSRLRTLWEVKILGASVNVTSNAKSLREDAPLPCIGAV